MSDSVLSVVGSARRSLFDRVRPDDVGAKGDKLRGAGGMALAALRHPDVSGGHSASADAVVLGGRVFGKPLDGWISLAEGDAVAAAYGVAAIRSRRTAGGCTWALIRIAGLRDGSVLEAVAALPTLPPVNLVPVIVGEAEDAPWARRMLAALGLDVHHAHNDDPWSVLSAMDRACLAAESHATVVVATRGQG